MKFALLLLENYWVTWSIKYLEAYQKEATYDEKTNKKEQQHEENTQQMHWDPRDLEGGQRKGWVSSMSCFISKTR